MSWTSFTVEKDPFPSRMMTVSCSMGFYYYFIIGRPGIIRIEMKRTMGSSKVQGAERILGIPLLQITEEHKTQILDLNTQRFGLEDLGKYVSRMW